MKCKSWSNKLNNFVVRKLKSFKINGQQKSNDNTMPTIPKEKMSTILPLNGTNSDDTIDNYNNFDNIMMKKTNNEQQQKCISIFGKQNLPSIITPSSKLQNSNCNNTINTTINNKDNNGIKSSTTTSSSSSSSSSAASTTTTTTRAPTATENFLARLSLTAEDIIGISDSNCANGYPTVNKMSVDDFIFGRTVGEGSFSNVYQAKDIHTNKEYAIKVCDKHHVLRERKQEYVRREREALELLGNTPGFVNLTGTFQDYQNLYFVMTYAKHGDLLPYIQKVGSFDLECARYYAAELLISIEQMHKKGIIHRDLKPENILLDKDMHTLITDFGSVKILGSDSRCDTLSSSSSPNRRRRCSFVGTAQYVSPEVLLGQDVTRATDLWALGCIIYQMLTGLYPFRGDNEYLIFKEILNLNLEFPDGFDRDAADLIRSLLKLNPEERIGYQDKIGRYESIRTHQFFDEINWDTVRKQQPPQICSCVMDLHKDDDEEFLCSR